MMGEVKVGGDMVTMHWLLRFILFCWLGRSAANQKFLYDAKDSVVREMKSRSAVSNIGKSEIRVYYAPWCFHCVRFAPTFKKVANTMSSEGYNVQFSAVSCVEHPDACKLQDLKGYPTIVAYNFPNDPQTLNPLGSKLKQNPAEIQDYIRKTATKLKTPNVQKEKYVTYLILL